MDNKDRWLAMLDLPSGNLTSFERQHDDAWVAGPNIGWRFGGWTSGVDAGQQAGLVLQRAIRL